MAPKSCPEAGEAKEEALPSPVDGEPVSSHLEPPADTPADLVAPASRRDTKLSSTQVASAKMPLAPESLDPHTLRLLWRQRELEIQALRSLQSQRDARRSRILREVASLPPESSHTQEKLLHVQVQKLTLELKEQKEQAQLEKKQVEEQLEQTKTVVQHLEAELEALHKSCLVTLASSSWVGRMLRSSTGSVEVVTAETLLDLSDASEHDDGNEGFRLEDVDWNAIAHRYPNLLASIHSSSEFKRTSRRQTPQLPPASPPEERGSGLDKPEERASRLGKLHSERKSVEWSSLPLVGTSSSESSAPDSGGRLLRKVTGRPPQAPSHISSEQIQVRPGSSTRGSQDSRPRSFIGDSQVFRTRSLLRISQDSRPRSSLRSSTKDSKADSEDRIGPVRKTRAVSDQWPLTHPWSRKGSCLKIVAVNLRERYIRVLNLSMEETVDLGGYTLQQLEHDFPVYLYRFPPHTLLAPHHHVTVWGKGSGSAKKPPPSSVGRAPRHFHPSRSFVTLLLSPKGEVLSQYRAPHSVTPAPRTFDDNTSVSIDRFPLPEVPPGAGSQEQGRPPRAPRHHRAPKARARSRRRQRTRALLPRLTPSKLFSPREVPAPPERAESNAREPLPALPSEQDGPDLADYQAGKEHRVRVCRKSVDRDCPIVALSVQSMTEKRFGFRLLSCPPVPVYACRPV
ncbi:lamin tail domain-containing protein 2 [Eptesicus fuscus]|uniref:lamin tail domain-containing protein 2 n=1 Tax=Eptesicus fuscus TaxID=29078 RepID=UPI002403B00C|nr:lamin tail domain-containing protein 2 [Eptesicus fuscus]